LRRDPFTLERRTLELRGCKGEGGRTIVLWEAFLSGGSYYKGKNKGKARAKVKQEHSQSKGIRIKTKASKGRGQFRADFGQRVDRVCGQLVGRFVGQFRADFFDTGVKPLFTLAWT
jgi:hypothetical protein